MFASNSTSISHIPPSLSLYSNAPTLDAAQASFIISYFLMLLPLFLSFSVCMMNGIRNFNHVAKVLRVVDTKRGKYEKFSRFIIAQEAGKLFMNIAKENFEMLFASWDGKRKGKSCQDEIAYSVVHMLRYLTQNSFIVFSVEGNVKCFLRTIFKRLKINLAKQVHSSIKVTIASTTGC